MHHGQQIKKLRLLQNNMQQPTLAERLGVRQQRISVIEQTKTLKPKMIERVAKALGVKPEDITGEKVEETKTIDVEDDTISFLKTGKWSLDKFLDVVQYFIKRDGQ